jgi:hypothetical protein
MKRQSRGETVHIPMSTSRIDAEVVVAVPH